MPVKRLIKTIAPFLILFCATSVFSQSDQTGADRWRGMVLNVSTPDDAIRLFGTPAKDKPKVALDVPRPLSWLADKCKEKLFRSFTYKRIEEFKSVQFFFLDGKLVAINMEASNAELEDKWIDPDDLEQLFGLVFKPNKRKTSKLFSPSEFQASAPAELKKDEYDYWYDMIAVSENSFIIAVADNYQYRSGLFESPDVKKRKQINSRSQRYPGYVSAIEIISRTLASS